LCNFAASAEKVATQWRSADNAATKHGILAENRAASARNDASYANMAANAVNSNRILLDGGLYVSFHFTIFDQYGNKNKT
jgi:hypothetical protein